MLFSCLLFRGQQRSGFDTAAFHINLPKPPFFDEGRIKTSRVYFMFRPKTVSRSPYMSLFRETGTRRGGVAEHVNSTGG